MKNPQIKLSKEQGKHVKSIQWLLGDNRCEGRSYLLAVVYVLEAVRGRRIKIIDHAYISQGAGQEANYNLALLVDNIISEYDLPLKVKWSTLEVIRQY